MNHLEMKINSAKSVGKDGRRFHDILANTGKTMESGYAQDVNNLYVMGTDGNLIRIADLNTDPEKQTETYTVVAMADHGEYHPETEEMRPTVEKQFGSCRVWLEDDGLHARMYYADDDELADHLWAIAEDASYSTGSTFYPDGYDGADNHIDGEVEILREISMVTAGNDPRTLTLAYLKAAAEGATGAAKANDKNNTNDNKETKMNKNLNALSEEDKAEIKALIKEGLDAAAASTEEADTEAEETTEATEEATETEAPEAPADGGEATTETNSLHMPIVVVNNAVKQSSTSSKKENWLFSNDGRKAFNEAFKNAGGRFNGTFASEWMNACKAHMRVNDITGLPTPAPVQELYFSTLKKGDGILNHVRATGLKSYRVTSFAADQTNETGRAHGHKKGDTKANQTVTAASRSVLPKMIYKRQEIDATDAYDNPYIMDFTAQELVDSIILEQERAIVIGDGRSEPAEGKPDYRMFDGTRGYYSIKADASAVSGIGTQLAKTISFQTGDNLKDAVQRARYQIKTEGALIVVAKSTAITDLVLAKDKEGRYLFQGTPEEILGVSRVYAPSWMDGDSNDAYVIVEGAYYEVGQTGVNAHPDFDTSKNVNILLDETMRGGSLTKHISAVAITSGS